MKFVIPTFYSAYGRYINRFRAIPYYIDCLKPVERRLLLSLAKCAKKKTKAATVIGHCIGHLHPHGDQSTYKALIQLVHRKFAFGQGNWGAPGLKDEFQAAAYRYTEIIQNKDLTNMFNEFLKFAEYEVLELESEPLYLPSIIPIGLIGSTMTTGISFYTTKLPHYTYIDLLNRLKYLLQVRYGDIVDTEPIIIPNIEGCDVYEDSPGEFKKILTTGIGTIQVVPKSTIDTTSNCLIICGKVPTERGGFNKLIKSQTSLNIRVLDDSTMKDGYKIIVEPPPRQRVSSNFELQILKLISSKIGVNCNVVFDNGSVKTHSIDQILLTNYDKWLSCYVKDRKSQLMRTREILSEIKIVEIVRNIIEHNPTIKLVSDIVNIYNSDSQYQIKTVSGNLIQDICNKYSIKKLIEHHFDIKKYTKQLNDIQYEIDNIEKFGFKRITSLTGD